MTSRFYLRAFGSHPLPIQCVESAAVTGVDKGHDFSPQIWASALGGCDSSSFVPLREVWLLKHISHTQIRGKGQDQASHENFDLETQVPMFYILHFFIPDYFLY